MILSSAGKHVELTKLDSLGDTYTMFPVSTADVIYMNEDAVALDQFIPSITSNVANVGNPMTCKEFSESVNLPAAALTALTGAAS